MSQASNSMINCAAQSDENYFSDLLLSLWATQGAAFQKHHDLSTEQGREYFVYWLLTNGGALFPGISDEIQRDLIRCSHIYPYCDGPVTSTLLLRSILRFRTDVQLKGSVNSEERFRSAWQWFLHGGFRDYGLPNGLPVISGVDLFECKFFESNGFKTVIPQVATFLFRIHNDYVKNIKKPYYIYSWYYHTGIWALSSLHNPFGDTVLAALAAKREERPLPDGVSPWASWFYDANLIADQFELLDSEQVEDQNIEGWWREFGIHLYCEANARLSTLLPELSLKPVVVQNSTETAPQIALVGYPKGEFGIGEDIRLLRQSLESVGLESTAFRVPGTIVAREGINEPCLDIAVLSSGVKTVFYAMPAFDTLMLYARNGRSNFPDAKKIGFWQWELEKFPREARFAFNLIDEVWCHSAHSENSFRVESNKPVYRVPLPVSVPVTSKANRSDYGLPEDSFVFFTSFDGASYISRKNPLATIEAFQRAFPKSERNVVLLIKVMNQQMSSIWRECMGRIASDSRIRVINQVMDRIEYYRLLQSIDAVISLHRAEGFGRLMAEAMAYSIPVIASGYSGNMDFMNDDNSWLVPGELVPLFSGDYPFHNGQRWFSADVDVASKMLIECREDAAIRLSKAEKGRNTIESNYSIDACGKFYKKLMGY